MMRKSGLYIVTLNNEQPISVNDHDPRKKDKAIKVTKDHLKFGRAKDFDARRKNYYKTFREHNVNYRPIVKMEYGDSRIAEKAILKKLNPYRIRGRTGHPNEWLENISADSVKEIIFKTLDELDLEYKIIKLKSH